MKWHCLFQIQSAMHINAMQRGALVHLCNAMHWCAGAMVHWCGSIRTKFNSRRSLWRALVAAPMSASLVPLLLLLLLLLHLGSVVVDGVHGVVDTTLAGVVNTVQLVWW